MTPEPRIERYLRCATLGLWGRRRREVREELESHIHERLAAHHVAGLPMDAAIERTLAELGSPAAVRSGMLRLHALPALIGAVAAATAVSVLTLATLVRTTAQTLPVTTSWPSPICLEAPETVLPQDCHSGQPWTSAEALRATLAPLGVEVEARTSTLVLRFPGARPVTLPLRSGHYRTDRNGAHLPSEHQPQTGYIPLFELYQEIGEQAGVRVRLDGWTSPTLLVGDITLAFDPSGGDMSAEPLYLTYAQRMLLDRHRNHSKEPVRIRFQRVDLLPGSTIRSANQALRLQVRAEPGTVYALVTVLEATKTTDTTTGSSELSLGLDIAPADSDGAVVLARPDVPFTFVGDFDSPRQQGATVLFRLTGEATVNGLGAEIIAPERITIE